MDKQIHRGQKITVSCESPHFPWRKGLFLYLSGAGMQTAVIMDKEANQLFGVDFQFVTLA